VLIRPSGDAGSPVQTLLSVDCWVMVVEHELSIIPYAIMLKFILP